MSMLPGIWTGDTTTHGGVLVEGEPTFTYGNKASAVLVGHKFWCPQCFCWSVFVEGEQSYTVDGRARVLQGHKASCGASAIHTQGFGYHINSANKGKEVFIKDHDAQSEINDIKSDGGDYYHSFRINNYSSEPVKYIVFSGGNILDEGSVSGPSSYSSTKTSKIKTHESSSLSIATRAPRLKI